MANSIDRNWHPNFVKYTEKMVKHPNYKGLFNGQRSSDGHIKWVVTGQSEEGKKRKVWWDRQCRKYGITIEKGCYAKVARMIHPTKIKVCQCCGKEVSVMYEYPNKNLLKRINKQFALTLAQTDFTIKEIISKHCKSQADVMFWSGVFNINMTQRIISHNTIATLRKRIIDEVYTKYVIKELSPLSPGVMSNCPDRFDGFHSDGLCCREKKDKGRSKENMDMYRQDRRAYEEWADGDFNLANRLMGAFAQENKTHICPKCGKRRKMTADHIGPISLGFCHSTHFAPLCRSCNSAKNNRLSKFDVDTLIALEKKGLQVVSWHSKAIWDALKHKVKTDDDAKKLSAVMLQCHQNVLKLFAKLYRETGRDYLCRFLHPEYAYYDYRFENFDPLHLNKIIVKKKSLDSANKTSNAQRYVRIAFESLKEFDSKKNRKATFVLGQYEPKIRKLIGLISKKDYSEADALLMELIRVVTMNIKKTMWI